MPDNIRIVSAEEFKDLAKDGAAATQDVALRKGWVCDTIKTIDVDRRLVDFVISTDTVDRMGDVVAVDGWDLKAYKKNPVILFGHDHASPPVAKSVNIGVEDLGKDNKAEGGKKALVSRAEFMSEEISPFAFSIFQMYVSGFMKATSVGFIAKEWVFTEDTDRRFGIDFHKQELIEYSVVPVPANPEALVDARSKGIDTVPLMDWAEEALDTYEQHTENGLVIPRKRIEQMRKHADPKARKTFKVARSDQIRMLRENLARVKATEEVETKDEPDDVEDLGSDAVTVDVGVEVEVESGDNEVCDETNIEETKETDIEETDVDEGEYDQDSEEGSKLGKTEDVELEDEEIEDEEIEDEEIEEEELSAVEVVTGLTTTIDWLLESEDAMADVKAMSETRMGRRQLRGFVDNLRDLADQTVGFLKNESNADESDDKTVANDDSFVLELETTDQESMSIDDDDLVDIDEDELAAMVEKALPELLAARKAKLTGKVE